MYNIYNVNVPTSIIIEVMQIWRLPVQDPTQHSSDSETDCDLVIAGALCPLTVTLSLHSDLRTTSLQLSKST